MLICNKIIEKKKIKYNKIKLFIMYVVVNNRDK